MKGSKFTLLSWLPGLAMMGLIFVASSLPGNSNLPRFFPHADKIAHFFTYGMLGFLIGYRKYFGAWFSGMSPEPEPAPPHRFDWIGFAVGAAYGVLDEIHQRFVPFRDFSYGDMAADAAGVWTGLLLSRRLLRKRGWKG